MLASPAKADILDRLRDDMNAAQLLGTRRASAMSTGFASLDRVLPGGGIHAGSLLEILDPSDGSGAMSLAAAITRAACALPSAIVVVDAERRFFPPAAAAWGMTSDRLIVVHPGNESEALWAAVQSLRCRAVGAVWLPRERLTPHEFRRLALAAEEGETLGVLFRPVAVRGQPTWAELQLLIESRPSDRGRKLRILATRCRGGAIGGAVEIEIDDATGGDADFVVLSDRVGRPDHSADVDDATGGDAEGSSREAFRMSAIAALADSEVASRTARASRAARAFTSARRAAR